MPNEKIRSLIKKLDKGGTMTREEYYHVMQKFFYKKIGCDVLMKIMDKARFNAENIRGTKLYESAKRVFDPGKLPYKDK